MSSGKQFTLYGGVIGPNPLKVAVALEELGLKLNPNGRVPTLVDHSNGDFTIWESDAILLYLVENYDKEHKLSVADVNEKFKLIQWLFFQSSGQGPYFGQAVWFMKYHQEKIPSAVERYQKEILRVFGVLESVLSKQEWLVGGHITVADRSTVFAQLDRDSNRLCARGCRGRQRREGVPVAMIRWHQKLVTRPVVRKFLDLQAESLKNIAERK